MPAVATTAKPQAARRPRTKTPLKRSHPEIAATLAIGWGHWAGKVTRGSQARLRWTCPDCQHSWKTRVAKRVRAYESQTQGLGCPACSRNMTGASASLAVLHPEIAAQLVPESRARARKVSPNSRIPLQWVCQDCTGVYESTPRNRVAGLVDCRACGGGWEARNPSVSDAPALSETHPDIAAQLAIGWTHWADKITAGSRRDLRWQCVDCNATWKAPVKRRTVNSSGCPACVGRQVSHDNSLDVTHTQIAAQLGLGEQYVACRVTAKSRRIVSWRCADCLGTWDTTVYNRAMLGHGCPHCSGNWSISVVRSWLRDSISRWRHLSKLQRARFFAVHGMLYSTGQGRTLLEALSTGRQRDPADLVEYLFGLGPAPLTQAILDGHAPILYGSKASIPRALRNAVIARDGNRCLCCGDSEHICMDHIHPEARGGKTVLENLQPLCRSCNSIKGARHVSIPELRELRELGSAWRDNRAALV